MRKYNLKENVALRRKLLGEAPLVASRAAAWPNYKPKKPWSGTNAKYESVLKTLAKPYPLEFSEISAYEMSVANDYMQFYQNGDVYSGNFSKTFTYGSHKDYPDAKLVIFDGDTVVGTIKVGADGKPKWTQVEPEKTEDEATESENPFLDGLQLALDLVGLIPGFGDIIDIINAGISFLRGNYLEGFLSLIGAIPVVGSAIAIPMKAALKGFTKAGDLLKSALKLGKPADELWLAIKQSGKLNKRELEMLAKGMGNAADYITKFRKEADAVLPDAAAKGLDDFAEFLARQGDEATEVFTKAAGKSDKAAKAILKVRKELDTVAGFNRILGGKLRRRLVNIFNAALSPKELEALRGAMSMKFFKNMDNPGKLTALAKSTPKLDLSTSIGTNLGQFVQRLPDGQRQSFQTAWDAIQNAGGGGSKILEAQLSFLKSNAPDVYKQAHSTIVNAAAKGNNPLYKQFMNSEINGLGSYFSKDYTNLLDWNAITARFSNLVPVLYNEFEDVSEDVKSIIGIEGPDDVNGLFWPMLKSIVSGAESAGIPGVEWTKNQVKGGVKGAATLLGMVPGADQLMGTDPLANRTYNPETEFVIHPDKSSIIKKRQKEKETRIDKSRSWF